jgi:hypothetical protein
MEAILYTAFIFVGVYQYYINILKNLDGTMVTLEKKKQKNDVPKSVFCNIFLIQLKNMDFSRELQFEISRFWYRFCNPPN